MGEREWWAATLMDGSVGRVFQGRAKAMEWAGAYLNQHNGICQGAGCQCRERMVAAIEAPDDTWGPPILLHNNAGNDESEDVTIALGRLLGPTDPEPAVPITRYTMSNMGPAN